MIKKENKELTISILSLIAVIVVLYLLFKYASIPSFPGENKYNRTKCPYKVEGNLSSQFVIKYIDSPYCVWCWIEEGVLKEVIAEKGSLFKLERYDIRYCPIARDYNISGTPSFVFSLEKENKEYVHTGFVSKSQFSKIICEVAEDCT